MSNDMTMSNSYCARRATRYCLLVTTPTTLTATRHQIRALRLEAELAGDDHQAHLCDLALDGDAEALTVCTGVILGTIGGGEFELSEVTKIADMLGLDWAWEHGTPIWSVRLTAADGRTVRATVQEGETGDDDIVWWATGRDGSDQTGSWGTIDDVVTTLTTID